jgi:hypothetical protein
MPLLLRLSAKSNGTGGVGILALGGIGVMTESNKRTSIQKKTSRLREVECPKCKAEFLFRGARLPHFDRHGFESYELDCRYCGVSLTGIIDPLDGTLPLSAP